MAADVEAVGAPAGRGAAPRGPHDRRHRLGRRGGHRRGPATFAALGVFGTLVVTAVTAQNTQAVSGVEILSPAFVDAQLDAVLADFRIDAAKTGMLATTAIVETVAQRAGAGAFGFLVVDPVMVASSGSPLIAGDASAAYRRLLPYATVVTPNLAEAEVLVGRRVRDEEAMAEAAMKLCRIGAGAGPRERRSPQGRGRGRRAVPRRRAHLVARPVGDDPQRPRDRLHALGGPGRLPRPGSRRASRRPARPRASSRPRSSGPPSGGLGHGAGPLHRLGPG